VALAEITQVIASRMENQNAFGKFSPINASDRLFSEEVKSVKVFLDLYFACYDFSQIHSSSNALPR